MKRILVAIFAMVVTSTWIASCSNDSQSPQAGNDSSPMSDSNKVPPPPKVQDTTSVTDTSYRIGDSK